MNTIELCAFMQLSELFRARNWNNPCAYELPGEMTGRELLAKLDIPAELVEVLFVNHKAYRPELATVRPGDRVALVPPGTPGPYRVFLGFKNSE
jgi:sulfur carrier protein ThiS